MSALSETWRRHLTDFRNGKAASPAIANVLRVKDYSIKSATCTIADRCLLATFHLSLPTWSGLHTFVITDALPARDLILGRDFLRASQAIVDHSSDTIQFRCVSDSRTAKCQLSEAVTLPPNSQSIVYCYADEAYVNEIALFEPETSLKDMYCASSLSTIKDPKRIPVSILNPRPHELKVPAHTTLGNLSTDAIDIVDRSNASALEAQTVSTTSSSPEESEPTGASRASEPSSNPAGTTKPSTTAPSQPKADWSRIKIGSCLTAQQRSELLDLLQRYADVFQWHEDDVGLTHLVEHKIDTGDTKPFRCRQFRTPHATIEDVEQQLSGLLRRHQVELVLGIDLAQSI
jgi:hypothetical protein